MVTLEIYEPPIGCGVGTCGPDAEEEQARFNAAVEWLEGRGVEVLRYNLGFEPEAFTSNATVKAAIKEQGIACLPIVIGNGRVVCERHYPSPGELVQQLGEPLPAP
ncbi:MAG: arsenic metallochaperone ArsD family protein [Caldimonas sp.]